MSYLVYGCIMLYHCGMSRAPLHVAQVVLLNADVRGDCLVDWVSGGTAGDHAGNGVHRERHHRGRAHGQAARRGLGLSQEEVRRLAATAERERIGRDLHDLLGHTLSLITLKLELSRKLFDRDAQAARREVEEAERVARHALSEVRNAVSGIRATDLAAELASARLLLESSGVHLDYELPQMDLPPEIEHSLSLVLREAVTNIARHAGASTAKIELQRDPACLRMRISDDGRGGVEKHGNGLSGIANACAR